MKRLFLFLKIFLAAVLMLFAFVGIVGRERVLEMVFGSIDTSTVDFATLELTPKPNQFLVCPKDLCKAPAHMPSPVFDKPLEELVSDWKSMLAKQEKIELVQEDVDLLQFDYIQRTPLMHYPDSITVRFLDLGNGQSTMAIYSRSHYGHSDLGANEKRIKHWLSQML